MDPVYQEISLRLLGALGVGAIIGLERSYRGRPAGFRTHALVCLSTALLMLVTVYESRWVPAIEYGPGDLVRKVDSDGFISFKNRAFRIGKPFRGQPVALRRTGAEDVMSIHFCAQRIGFIDLRRDHDACGFMDIARAMPTTPQAQQHHQSV